MCGRVDVRGGEREYWRASDRERDGENRGRKRGRLIYFGEQERKEK